MSTTPGVTPNRDLPESQQDVCKYCGSKRTQHQGNNGRPRCPRQGCPGQH